MNMNDLINEFVDLKSQREELSEQTKKINERMAAIEAALMEQMASAGLSQAASDRASCSMRQVKRPVIKDWNIFYAHVAETKQFELLHKRLASTAFSERWEAGETIPGTDVSSNWELSVRRK